MRINMCAAIISMQTFFLIGAHVKAQQVLVCFASHSNTFGNDADVWQFKFAHGYWICYINYHPWYWTTHSPLGMRLCQWYQKHNILWSSSRIQSHKVRFFSFQTLCGFLAFAIYFSVLAEFSWLLLHGLRIHGKIKKIFASNLNIEIVYVVIGWGKSSFK